MARGCSPELADVSGTRRAHRLSRRVSCASLRRSARAHLLSAGPLLGVSCPRLQGAYVIDGWRREGAKSEVLAAAPRPPRLMSSTLHPRSVPDLTRPLAPPLLAPCACSPHASLLSRPFSSSHPHPAVCGRGGLTRDLLSSGALGFGPRRARIGSDARPHVPMLPAERRGLAHLYVSRGNGEKEAGVRTCFTCCGDN